MGRQTDRQTDRQTNDLVSAADLWLTSDVDNASKLHESMMIKDVTNAEVIAVTCEIVPLVHVYAIALVRNYLHSQLSRQYYTTQTRTLYSAIIR